MDASLADIQCSRTSSSTVQSGSFKDYIPQQEQANFFRVKKGKESFKIKSDFFEFGNAYLRFYFPNAKKQNKILCSNFGTIFEDLTSKKFLGQTGKTSFEYRVDDYQVYHIEPFKDPSINKVMSSDNHESQQLDYIQRSISERKQTNWIQLNIDIKKQTVESIEPKIEVEISKQEIAQHEGDYFEDAQKFVQNQSWEDQLNIVDISQQKMRTEEDVRNQQLLYLQRLEQKQLRIVELENIISQKQKKQQELTEELLRMKHLYRAKAQQSAHLKSSAQQLIELAGKMGSLARGMQEEEDE